MTDLQEYGGKSHTQKELEKLFEGAIVTQLENENGIVWSVYSYDGNYGDFNLSHLLKVCEILKCEPEELFWNPDIDYSGCYYGEPGDLGLTFSVRRK